MSTLMGAKKSSPLEFFVLVFVLSIPFWLIGALSPLQLLPGLPVSSLAVFCPLIAASILIYREHKTDGVAALFKRSFDYKRIKAKIWYLPTILLIPGIAVLAYFGMRLAGMPLPKPEFPVLEALAMFLLFFIAGLGEELGWMGYAFSPLQERWNALQAALLLGLVGAAWHIVLFVEAGRSPLWIAWQGLNLVAVRVLIVWLYNNTGGSIFAASLCHATVNLSWQLFPNNGSHYDPRVTALITVFAAAIVAVIWGPRTLTRNRKF